MGISETILTETATDRENLRIGSIEFEERSNGLILKVSSRYKPQNEEDWGDDDLDRWGYIETEFIPVMEFSGGEKELTLIREFTKLAVDKAGGFANFHKTATKTKSLLDRLEELTLPKLEDVEDGLKKYLEVKKNADELDEKIQKIDELIDQIVYKLYGLTDEEIQIVEESFE